MILLGFRIRLGCHHRYHYIDKPDPDKRDRYGRVVRSMLCKAGLPKPLGAYAARQAAYAALISLTSARLHRNILDNIIFPIRFLAAPDDRPIGISFCRLPGHLRQKTMLGVGTSPHANARKTALFTLYYIMSDKAPQVRQRPFSVTAASLCLALGFAVGLMNAIFTAHWREPIVPFLYATVCLLFFLFLRAIYIGRRWARWLGIGITVLGLLGFPTAFGRLADSIERIRFLAQTVSQTAAGVLLLLPTAHRWYSPSERNAGFSVPLRRGPFASQLGRVLLAVFASFLVLYLFRLFLGSR